MPDFKNIILILLTAGIALSATGCWHVLALQGAMAAAQIAGAETEHDPTPEYRQDQDEYIQEYFSKDRYGEKPSDPALAKVPQPAAGDMAVGHDSDPLLETPPLPASGESAAGASPHADNGPETRDATSLAEEFKAAP